MTELGNNKHATKMRYIGLFCPAAFQSINILPRNIASIINKYNKIVKHELQLFFNYIAIKHKYHKINNIDKIFLRALETDDTLCWCLFIYFVIKNLFWNSILQKFINLQWTHSLKPNLYIWVLLKARSKYFLSIHLILKQKSCVDLRSTWSNTENPHY